jgi:uncharacterized protein (TIGR03067 family)
MRHQLILVVVGLILALTTSAVADDEADARKKLVGEWQGYVVDGKGENPNRGPVKLTITITADGMTAKQEGNKDLGAGNYKLDLSGDPKTLDAVRTSTPGKGQTYLGIYSVDGDTLKWCVGQPKQPRPTEFVTKSTGGQFLMVLKRQKK